MSKRLPPLKYTRDGLTIATTKRYQEAYMAFPVEAYRLIVTDQSGKVVAVGAGHTHKLTTDDLAHILDGVLNDCNKSAMETPQWFSQ